MVRHRSHERAIHLTHHFVQETCVRCLRAIFLHGGEDTLALIAPNREITEEKAVRAAGFLHSSRSCRALCTIRHG